MTPCVACTHPVSGGGNRHRAGTCPPSPQPGYNRLARKRRRNRPMGFTIPPRGMPIPKTGKPSASSKVTK